MLITLKVFLLYMNNRHITICTKGVKIPMRKQWIRLLSLDSKIYLSYILLSKEINLTNCLYTKISNYKPYVERVVRLRVPCMNKNYRYSV